MAEGNLLKLVQSTEAAVVKEAAKYEDVELSSQKKMPPRAAMEWSRRASKGEVEEEQHPVQATVAYSSTVSHSCTSSGTQTGLFSSSSYCEKKTTTDSALSLTDIS